MSRPARRLEDRAKPFVAKARPIGFQARSIQSILLGFKTQTRRLPQHQPIKMTEPPSASSPGDDWMEIPNLWIRLKDFHTTCRYGTAGHFLWARETFWIQHDAESERIDLATDTWAEVQYCATPLNPDAPGPGFWFTPDPEFEPEGETVWISWHDVSKPYSKRPYIFMPFWASRIHLQILAVRTERLQEISEADAIAEGIVFDGEWYLGPIHPKKGTRKVYNTARQAYAALWDSINGDKLSWASNPYVHVITFQPIERIPSHVKTPRGCNDDYAAVNRASKGDVHQP